MRIPASLPIPGPSPDTRGIRAELHCGHADLADVTGLCEELLDHIEGKGMQPPKPRPPWDVRHVIRPDIAGIKEAFLHRLPDAATNNVVHSLVAWIEHLEGQLPSLASASKPEDYDQRAVAAEHVATAGEMLTRIQRSYTFLSADVSDTVNLCAETLAAVRALVGR